MKIQNILRVSLELVFVVLAIILGIIAHNLNSTGDTHQPIVIDMPSPDGLCETPEPVLITAEATESPVIETATPIALPLVKTFPVTFTASPTPTTTPSPTPAPTPSPTPQPTALIESTEWLPYLATSYTSRESNPHGNRGESLAGKKAIAMWQSDTDYTKYRSMIEPFRSMLTDKAQAAKFGALPYGTQMEVRVWDQTQNAYRNLGVYTVLDDSPTTIYNLSPVAQSLKGKTGPLTFSYSWSATDYIGRKTNPGPFTGYIANWHERYSNAVIGWLDLWEGPGGMLIVEIRIIH